jgi:hypothetical protein
VGRLGRRCNGVDGLALLFLACRLFGLARAFPFFFSEAAFVMSKLKKTASPRFVQKKSI